MSPKVKVGVIAGDRATDQLALTKYLLPDLKRHRRDAGGRDDPGPAIAETATTDSQAPLIVEKLQAAGVDSVIPLMPFNAFLPGARRPRRRRSTSPSCCCPTTSSSIESSLGLLPVPYEKALDGQEGVTTETLGGDRRLPAAGGQGGYDPGVRSCWTIWHKAYPEIPKGNMNDFIEEQGPVQGWCQEIRLFDQAATAAGKTSTGGPSSTPCPRSTNFPGGYSPILSLRAGQVLRADANTRWSACTTTCPPRAQCRLPLGTAAPAGALLAHRSRRWKPLPKARDDRRRACQRERSAVGGGRLVPPRGRLLPEDVVRAAQADCRPLFPTAEEFAADRRSRAQPSLPRRLAPGDARLSLRGRRAQPTWSCTTASSTWPRSSSARATSASTRAWSAPSTPTGPRRRAAAPRRLRQPHPGGAPARGGLPAPRALHLPERRDARDGGDADGVAPADRRHPDRADLPQPDRVRPPLRGRGARPRARPAPSWPTGPTSITGACG